jgi:F420-non-reducing hydrogenase iron-sulfur subunit
MAGVSRLQYSSEIRLVRVMCSGRVDLGFVLRALRNGYAGVFIGGCKLGECNYTTEGNWDALGVALFCRKILAHLGLDPERLRIAFMSGGDGNLLAEVIDDFSAKIRELGPLGAKEGLDSEALATDLEVAERLVPYLRLVERERLRVPVRTEEAYEALFSGDEFERLFEEIFADRLAVGRIVRLLGDGALSTAEISQRLSLSPSEVSRHMMGSSRHGLVRYDVGEKRYRLA